MEDSFPGTREKSHRLLSLTRVLIFGEKPSLSEYVPHPSDAWPLQDPQELHFSDFAKIATGEEEFILPPTVNSSAAANILVDTFPTSMFRTVLAVGKVSGLFRKDESLPTDNKPEGLECAAFEGCCTISPIGEEDQLLGKPEESLVDSRAVTRPEVSRKGRRG